MMCALFNGNPSATISSYCSPSYETNVINFYNLLYFFIQLIPKHNVLIVCGNMNVQIGKDENNKFYSYNTSKINGESLTDFSLENRLACLDTKFRKNEGKTMDRHLPKALLDYELINKKRINTLGTAMSLLI